MKKGKSISDWMTSARQAKPHPPPVNPAPSRKRKAPSSSVRNDGQTNNSKSDHTPLDSGCIPGDELPWATKHQPTATTDLAVHKKKVAEVQQWLEFALSPHSRHPILLLTGPPGCGKTATLNALSQDMSFSVLEWTNPVPGSKVEASNRDDLIIFPESQSKQFQNFLMRANRYPSLLVGGVSGGGANKKVVLVEEFPNAFLRDPSEFHRLMKSVVSSLLYPLVFIASESHHRMSSPSKLFTKTVLSDLDIHSVSFNPIAHTSLVKTIQKISAIECCTSKGRGDPRGAVEGKFHMPPREVIESLAESSAGDVRSAINALQFACLRDSTDLLRCRRAPASKGDRKSVKLLRQRSTSSSKLRKHSSTDLSLKHSMAIGGRDSSLFLFRALGKILYCKRDIECETTPTLPASLRHKERQPLLVNPEDVLEHTHMTTEMFTLYLHQNYLAFFDSEEDTNEGVAYLSDADLLSRPWSDCKDTRSALEGYSGSVACRGLIFTNRSTAVGKWRPLHKPQWMNVNRQYKENCSTARELFLHLGASPFSHLWTPIELQTEILPYLAIINPPLRNTGQASFLQTLTHFKTNCQRLGAETLGEKDTDDLPTVDSEQGQSIDPSNDPSTNKLNSASNTQKQTQIATGSTSHSQAENIFLSQSSSSSQPRSQDVSAVVDSDSKDVDIEDFEDDLIW